MKVSEFVETLSSHDIYDSKQLAEDFEAECGVKAGWKGYSMGGLRCSALGDHRNCEAPDSAPDHLLVVGGFEVAEWAARQFAPSKAKVLDGLMGRGTRFREAVSILEQVGK